MKRIVTLFALIVLVLCSGAASAAEYKTQKGDTLWGIAKTKLGKGSLWHEIAAVNKISDPKKLRVGQTLTIPDAEKEEGKKESVFLYKHPGAEPFKGTLEEALKLLDYPKEVQELLKKEVESGNKEEFQIRLGDRFFMVYTDKQTGIHVVEYSIGAWDPEKYGDLLAADKYTVIWNEKEYTLTRCWWCNNWTRYAEKVAPAEEKIEALEAIPEEIPTTPLTIAPAEAKCCPPEHEPIIGAGGWGNGIAKGYFAYSEYMLWLKARCDSEWSYGLGFYGNWEEGESKLSAYDWDGYALGPQIGIKRYWFYTDKESRERPQQWQAKLRLLWEDQQGRNRKSGYHMEQDNLKLGLYTEYVRQMNDDWLGILIAEGWWAPDKTIHSSWNGDSPQSRTQAMLGIYAQYKISDDWQTRFGGGPFYQGWDDLVGLHLRAELRWKEIVMFGPYANLFAWKSHIYKGIPLSDLQTFGGFVRIELGNPIRHWDQKRRMERVKLIHQENLDKTERGDTLENHGL